MTMHMIQGVNTSRTRKLKPKMTKTNLQRWAQEMQKYNKKARRQNEQQLTLDQYIDYAHGHGIPKPQRKFEEYQPVQTYAQIRAQQTKKYPSATTNINPNSCARPETKRYTGTLVKGIATMHKSNAVPIIDDQQAKDISNMRRN